MSECGQFDLITVSDVNSCYVLRYLRLCNGRFFGGNTWDRIDGFVVILDAVPRYFLERVTELNPQLKQSFVD